MESLKCFISAPYDTDISIVKNILSEKGVEVFDLYDFAIGESLQEILKRKLRQADFAIFIVTNHNENVLYEMGVCEGLGKQYFIFVEKGLKIPFYIENKLYLNTNLKDYNFLLFSIDNILQTVKKNKKELLLKRDKAKQTCIYENDIINNLKGYLSQITKMREAGTGMEFEYLVGDIFKTIKLNYISSDRSFDKGADFAIWNDELGKLWGNPIIVEIKYGKLNNNICFQAEQQIKKYIDKTDTRLALFLYLDRNNQRFNFISSLNPLIVVYDLEDFVNDLINESFERIIIDYRNKIVHNNNA